MQPQRLTAGMPVPRLLACVFLPFAAGYYLSYLFRTINAVIAGRLTAELDLDAAQLGLLTSAYFLVFAALQLPVGAALDRFGPRRVQVLLLAVASGGALIFATADAYPLLLLGRGLVGFGVAGALMAGLKAIVLWFPKERVSLANGAFVTLGAAGALTATLPAAWAMTLIGWRGLFLLLALATAAVALLIHLVVPERQTPAAAAQGIDLKAIVMDGRFWCLAPLSASCIGTAWALQGLWAAPWLADVGRLSQGAVVRHLFEMSLALCAGAMALGIVADRLRRRGVGPDTLLGVAASLFIAAELGLILGGPVATDALWAIVAAMGSATVLSYAIMSELFPKEVAGRANGALNVLHIGGAFLIQSAIGVILQRWPVSPRGHHPAAAYAAAFGVMVVLQIAALAWFLLRGRGSLRRTPAVAIAK